MKKIDLKLKAQSILNESIEVEKKLLETQADVIAEIAATLISAFKSGKKLLIFGNGGSAADSQHIAAEFIGRFKKERAPLRAIALTTNTSILTALSNDYGYAASFKRQVEGLADAGDIAMGISTSGNSENVREALISARALGMKLITMTGEDGGKISKMADITLKSPSNDTPRIQESHITAGHIICELVESEFGK